MAKKQKGIEEVEQKSPDGVVLSEPPAKGPFSGLDKKQQGVFVAVAIIAFGLVGFGLSSRTTIEDGLARGDVKLEEEFAASSDQVGEVDEMIENGFFFDPGPEPTDPTDYDTFTVPEAPQELEDEFIRVVNSSPAFEDIDSVYEIVEYSDFDKDGNIKEEVMRDIIEIGEAALE